MWTSKIARIAWSLSAGALSATCVAAWISIWAATPLVAGSDIYTGQPISLELTEANLVNVLAMFSEATDCVVVADARTAAEGGLDRTVTVNYEEIPWDQALDEILAASGLEWTLEGKVLWIHLPAITPSGNRNFTGNAINLRLQEAKLADVLSNLSKVTGLGIDFDPAMDTTVTVSLRGIPWDQVLDLVVRISGYEYALEGESITVFRVSDEKGMQFLPPPGV